jgi:transcriptional regulator GlxA family with amidase domain
MHSIGFIVFPMFSPINFAATSVFETANWKLGMPEYQLTLLSEHGGSVATSLGFHIQTSSFKRRTFDTVIVAGGLESPVGTPGLVKYLQSTIHRSRRIASICTGALVLAEAGLLDGRRATTHWSAAREMKRRYPRIAVEEDRIFIADGPIWTSAGMSAGIDLALAMVESDLGIDIARMVAQILVVYHRRAGGQSQFSTLLDLAPQSDRIQTSLTYAKKNLRFPLPVATLAKAAFLSPRQFSRVFREETGRSPAQAIDRLRVESARLMMEGGRFSAEEIARKNGFVNRERMRRSFLRAFGYPPQAIQRTVAASIP